MSDLYGFTDRFRAALRARSGDEPELVLMDKNGQQRTIARGPIAALLRFTRLGTSERYTVEWAGWSRPFSVRVVRWEGDGAIWQSTGAGNMFAPLFYVRYQLAKRAQRSAFPRARVVR